MRDNDLIKQAKQELGDKAAGIIAHGMGLEKWDDRKMVGCCPLHREKTPSFSWNKKSNSFKCFGCGATMDIIDFYQRKGMDFQEAVKELFAETGHQYEADAIEKKKDYKYPSPETNTSLDQAEKYLVMRKISKETIDYAGVKQDSKGNIVFEFRDQHSELMTVKYRPSRKLGKGETKTWCQSGKDTAPVLYGMEKIDTTKPLLICEGEIDRLSAIEAGFTNAVSVPFGAGNYGWIEYNWSWLEQFEKIIIWSDMDEAGEKMRNEVAPRLGEYRCYIVTGKRKDINLQLFYDGKESVLESIEKAQEVPIKGIIDMADVGEYDFNRAEKIRSGINGLDKWIAGFVMGTVDIITGINGSGKSTFINQVCICEALEQGYKTFIFSGELPKQQLRSWTEFPMAGPNNVIKIDNGPHQPVGYYVPKPIKDKMRAWYRGKVFIYDSDMDYTATSILQKMEELYKRYGVKNFVLDNLMMIDLECKENEKYTYQKNFVHSLMKFAGRYGVVVHLVAHPKKVEAIRRLTKLDVCGSGDIVNMAHYAISIHRVTPDEKEPVCNKAGKITKEGCEFDCIIDLFKNRPASHQDKTVGVFYEASSKRFYGKSDDKNRKYGWEVQDIESEHGDAWEGDEDGDPF